MKKRGFLVLALVMTTAGVASAFAPVPQDSAPRPPTRDLAMPVVAPQPAAALAAAPVPEPVVKKVSVEVRQAPVPLLMKPRPPVEEKTIDAATVAATPEVSAKTPDATGDSAAKAAIEADGYKGVKALRQGGNGIWFARAMRGTTEVALTVDASGRVSLE
jgi:hypothetical protein